MIELIQAAGPKASARLIPSYRLSKVLDNVVESMYVLEHTNKDKGSPGDGWDRTFFE